MAVAAVVLLAAGAGATFFFMKGKMGAKEEKVEPVLEQLYFEMKTPLMVNFPPGSIATHGRFSAAILVRGAELIDVLKKNEPMIRNNFLLLISAKEAAVLNTREGKEALRKEMVSSVNEVLEKMSGEGHIEEVFYTSFVMQ